MIEPRKPPETIYLQWYHPEEVGGNEYGTTIETTWCSDKINDDDVAYLRLDGDVQARIEQAGRDRDAHAEMATFWRSQYTAVMKALKALYGEVLATDDIGDIAWSPSAATLEMVNVAISGTAAVSPRVKRGGA